MIPIFFNSERIDPINGTVEAGYSGVFSEQVEDFVYAGAFLFSGQSDAHGLGQFAEFDAFLLDDFFESSF